MTQTGDKDQTHAHFHTRPHTLFSHTGHLRVEVGVAVVRVLSSKLLQLANYGLVHLLPEPLLLLQVHFHLVEIIQNGLVELVILLAPML